MGIQEGIHALTQCSRNNNLELDDGWWHFGDAETCKKNDNNNLEQQWFVARPPGVGDDEFVVFNLRRGNYAGVWKDEWGSGNHRVKCSPSHLSAANIRWKTSQAPGDPSSQILRWVGDSTKVLSCDSSLLSSTKVCVKHADDNKKEVHWRIDQFMTASGDGWRGWMSRLPDDIKLDDINLPSTHQSLAGHGIDHVRPDLDWSNKGDDQARPWVRLPQYIDNPHCQNISVYEQLQMGVRALDMRLDLDRAPVLKLQPDGTLREESAYYLYARHGLAEIGYSWSAVLLSLRTFLRANPSEFVLITARYERSMTPNTRDRFQDYLRIFVDETEPFWTEENPIIYKWWENGARNMTDLCLSDVRGKAILVCDDNYMPADSRDGRNPDLRFMPRNCSNVGKYDSLRDQWDQQLSSCEANLSAAKSDREDPPSGHGDRKYYTTSFNVSGLPDPLKFTFVFTQMMHLTQAVQNAKNEVFDPIDFFRYFKERWEARGDDSPLSERSLGKNGQNRIGKVDLDYCDQVPEWVANIVRSNRTKPGQEF